MFTINSALPQKKTWLQIRERRSFTFTFTNCFNIKKKLCTSIGNSIEKNNIKIPNDILFLTSWTFSLEFRRYYDKRRQKKILLFIFLLKEDRNFNVRNYFKIWELFFKDGFLLIRIKLNLKFCSKLDDIWILIVRKPHNF